MVNENTERTWKSTPVFEELEEFVRREIQQKLQSLLDEEVEEFLGRIKYERRSGGETGYRNGYAPPRKLSMMSGTIEVRRPKLRDLDEKFESVILPRFKRKSKSVEEVLPELYLHGLSLGDFDLALRGLLGDGAPLSPSSIQRLKVRWQEEFEEWNTHRLDGFKVVYIWADGIYVKAGFEKEKAALLVVIGAGVEPSKWEYGPSIVAPGQVLMVPLGTCYMRMDPASEELEIEYFGDIYIPTSMTYETAVSGRKSVVLNMEEIPPVLNAFTGPVIEEESAEESDQNTTAKNRSNSG